MVRLAQFCVKCVQRASVSLGEWMRGLCMRRSARCHGQAALGLGCYDRAWELSGGGGRGQDADPGTALGIVLMRYFNNSLLQN